MESEFLAVGCSDNSVHVWDISNSKMVLKVQSPGLFQLHYMPWIGFYVYYFLFILMRLCLSLDHSAVPSVLNAIMGSQS